MKLLDPAERSRTGARQQTEVLAAVAPEPATLFESSWRDFVFAEVWARPGLDRRSRYLIAMASVASANGPREVLEGFIRGALKSGELKLAELREAVLQVATYGGWPQACFFDTTITSVANALGLPPAPYAPIRVEPWDPEVRLSEGVANFKAVAVMDPPPPGMPPFVDGVLNFVMAELWARPGLDQRARRWVTLGCVANSSSPPAIRAHIWGAMASGNATLDEMHEFVLQYATHGGWPKATMLYSVVIEMGQRIAKGLPYA
jgi:4-carboxymuconolactone decarboxylase